jgi:hypothetical protein
MDKYLQNELRIASPDERIGIYDLRRESGSRCIERCFFFCVWVVRNMKCLQASVFQFQVFGLQMMWVLIRLRNITILG